MFPILQHGLTQHRIVMSVFVVFLYTTETLGYPPVNIGMPRTETAFDVFRHDRSTGKFHVISRQSQEQSRNGSSRHDSRSLFAFIYIFESHCSNECWRFLKGILHKLPTKKTAQSSQTKTKTNENISTQFQRVNTKNTNKHG